MKKDKARYMITYGLYPALKEKQQTKINASPWSTVSFDESLKCHQLKCKMDMDIHYWDGEKNVAQSISIQALFLVNVPQILYVNAGCLKFQS